MQTKGIIIQASARSNGNTSKTVSYFQNLTNFDVVDLAQLNIGHFDYEFGNSGDDFTELIQKIANNYETIIFATPVYWYTMSGLMKVFLDRISDCLIVDKETGRKLRDKSLGLIICGSQAEETYGFDLPIKSTAQYLGMNYLGYVHTWASSEGLSSMVENKLLVYSKNLEALPVHN